ncbi:MAG: helix-turn-helix transcriptional regulator [Ginsengibacter sp.]
MKNQVKNITHRKAEIADKFLLELNKHIKHLISGEIETSYEINQFADLLYINPNHLSDTIKEVLGKSPCAVYEEKLIEAAKELMDNTDKPINEIASILSYDHTNFTKFFKRTTGTTPKKYRNEKQH